VRLRSRPAVSAAKHAPPTGVSIVKIVLGVLLLLLAVKQWRGRPRRGAEPDLPAWMRTIDTFTPAKSAGTAVLLAAVNPKNLLLVVGGAAAIAQTGASTASQAVALIVFTVIATLGVGAPVVIYFLSARSRDDDPRRSARLDDARERHGHGCYPPDHRSEADRRRDQRPRELGRAQPQPVNISRRSIGDRAPGLHTASDDSLTITMQHEEPSDPTRRANWLTAEPVYVGGMPAAEATTRMTCKQRPRWLAGCGRHNQSIVPSSATTAAVRPSPMTA
jgi:Sap, sulfolipid-1-addressing protein